MTRRARDFRLIPVVLIATVCLFALKVSGLVFDGGYTLSERLASRNKAALTVVDPASVPDYPRIVLAGDPAVVASAPAKPWAKEMFNCQNDGADITGSVEKKEDKPAGPALKVSTKAPDAPKLEAGNSSITVEPGKVLSSGERAILESLQNRRKALDQRSRELEMRVEAKVAELKDLEARLKASMGERDKAEAERFKAIITMYENMKAKEAARIFDKLDMKVLVDVANAMNPRSMSQILAQMTPESAERLTVELAKLSSANKTPDALPKIENKPGGT